MKKFLYAAASLALLSLTVACNESEDCKSNLDCPNNQICSADNVCVAPGNDCVMDEDCSGNFTCNQTTNVCNTSCSSNDQCVGAFECNTAGVCQNPGGNVVYNRVLVFSATPDNKSEGSCREGNPGADIDYIEVISGGTGVAPTDAVGARSTKIGADGNEGVCGSEPQTYWVDADEVLVRDSIPAVIPGVCTLSDKPNGTSPYFFLGLGETLVQGDTIAATTGRFVATFENTFADGDIIKVWEVNGADGAGGEEICTNVDTARTNDKYTVVLVSSTADIGDKGAGVALNSPDFLVLGTANGIAEFTVTLD